MGKDKGFRTMNDLVEALAEAGRGLGRGDLDLQGLETACADARELYERLVVLRHKAREGKHAAAAPAPAEAPKPAATEAVNSPRKAEPTPPVAEVSEPAAIRLDTRPVEVSPRQVSLIEAIEASEEAPAPKPSPEPAPKKAATKAIAPSAGKAPETLAEKLEKASIQDLGKAISLSHKFWFVAELFNGDRIGYDRTIMRLNEQPDLASAMTYLEQEVIVKLNKPADPEALATFTELLQRRYA